MKYLSTRGQPVANTFEDALFYGFAPDGGILVPEIIPQISASTLTDWKKKKLSYPQVVEKIIRLYVPSSEIPDEELAKCIHHAYSVKFTSKEIIPIQEIVVPGTTAGVNCKVKIAELYHGRTLSFKDFALSLIGQLMDYYLAKRRSHTIVLVGTSGDTGSAAMDAVSDSANIDIIVLYPRGKVSPVQELQLKSILSKNIQLFEVDGNSDELDIPIKRCFPGENLTSINSINWARIMIQAAHYFYLYIKNSEDNNKSSSSATSVEKELNVIIPTGAAGNLVSGLFAIKMGLPMKLHVAANQNDVVTKFLQDGAFRYKNAIVTPANAMDIGMPYNLERILYLFSNGDTRMVAAVMKDVESGKGATISSEILGRIRQVMVCAVSVSDGSIYATIKKCWDNNKYMVCPHTATALYYYQHNIVRNSLYDPEHKSYYIISTASPLKFPEISEQVGIPLQEWNGNELIDKLSASPLMTPKSMWKGESWYKILAEEINKIQSRKS